MLFAWQNRILRLVSAAGATEAGSFLDSIVGQRFLADGRVVATRRVIEPEVRGLVERLGMQSPPPLMLEHDRIPFPSFPYEWPAEMLHAAGALTVDLAEEALEAGFGLKDATPYNVLFRGPAPVFVDLLSFERRDKLNRTWLAYAQFIRTFLLPLAASRHFGMAPGNILLQRRDGLDPAEMYRWCGPLGRLRPPFLGLVTIPKWLSGAAGGGLAPGRMQLAASPEQARFVLGSLFRSLRRTLNRVAPKAERGSAWTGYLESKSLYTRHQLACKEEFVRQAVAGTRPDAVLDVGANEGHFSAICARAGAAVVAIDSDPVVAGRLWRKARAEGLNILPLVVDVARPSPAAGWRNRECSSFLDRARGAFDLVAMLALLHHLLVTERVPLHEIVDLAAELTTKFLLIEFVGPRDPMFQRIARGREALHADLTRGSFEAALRARFELVRSLPIEGLDRCLYLACKKTR
ncbi:MAG: class I SAM-dependent methyltransferase [Bryobacteraceae bacterium]